jgi:prepilin-type N-terminal cleavage/methylation domain-containing protein
MAECRICTTGRERGFTLLELLVSIVILTLIVTVSYSALMVGSRSWQGTASTIKDNATSRFAVQFIRNKIEQMYPIFWNDGRKRILAFQGEDDGVKFIAPAPQGRETQEYYEYYITTDLDEMENVMLLLYFEPHDPSSEAFKVSRKSPVRKLLSHLSMVKYSYFGSQRTRDLPDWHSVWNDDSVDYPMLFKLEMVGADEEETWLDIAVEPRSRLNTQGVLP